MKYTIRAAENSEGDHVQRLVEADGIFLPGLEIDWHDIHPNWLVAENKHGVIIGCLQVLPGKPIGRLEMLATHEDLNDRERAIIVRGLLRGGMAVCKKIGAVGVSGVVPFEKKSYKHILKRRGAVVVSSGNLMVKAI